MHRLSVTPYTLFFRANMKHRYLRLFPLAVLLFLASCTAQPPQKAAADALTYFPMEIGSSTVRLQLALNERERAQGLMYRDALATDHGMLFLFENAAPRAFWMRNTRIPLDLGYFGPDGRLLEIHKLYPHDETSVPSRSGNVLIAVETNRGWFSRNKIQPGAHIDLTALAEAVRQRGQSPENYQLSPID